MECSENGKDVMNARPGWEEKLAILGGWSDINVDENGKSITTWGFRLSGRTQVDFKKKKRLRVDFQEAGWWGRVWL